MTTVRQEISFAAAGELWHEIILGLKGDLIKCNVLLLSTINCFLGVTKGESATGLRR